MKIVLGTWERAVGFTTTVAEREASELGQSILEFLLMFPMLIGMTVMLIRINTAIQISIVDQQYARAQALFLAYNSAFYPELTKTARMVQYTTNQVVIGVSDNAMGSSDGSSSYLPSATEQLVARSTKMQGSNAPREEPQARSKVRIRDTVTLCAPTVFLLGGGGAAQPILQLNPANPSQVMGVNTLHEGSRFNNLCGSSIQYEQ